MSKLYLTGRQKPVFISYLRLLLLISIFTAFTAQSFGQTTYTFSFKQASLNNVISEIATKTNYQFVYDASFNQKAKPISAEIKSSDINEILTQVFKDQDFTYRVNGKTIVIKSKSAGENTYTLHGMVNDNESMLMPGVTVRQKGTQNIVHTDKNGHFGIDVSDSNNTLEFSYIGYEKKEIKYSKNATGSVIIVSLAPSNSLLNEVVVTGYQTLNKLNTPAAAQVITEKELTENVPSGLLEALEGRIAGLFYRKNTTGSAADQPILRGMGTFSAEVGYSPLLVIDGLPTELTLGDVNPYDIASVTVLKDAAAAAIYGSRAGNGVIVLTTKKGSGATKISFNTDFFVSTKPNLNDMHYASTSQMIDYEQAVYNNERSRYPNLATMFNNYGDVGNSSMKYYSPLYQLNRDLEEGKITSTVFNNTVDQWRQNDYITDYVDNVWQNEFRQRYNLSFSGGNAKQNTYLSLNYDDSKQRIKYNTGKSFNLYAKSSFQLKSWLNATVGINASYAISDATDGSFGDYSLQKRYERIMDDNGNLVYVPFVNASDGFTSSFSINPAAAAKINANSALKPLTFNVLDELQQGKTEANNLSLRAFTNLEAKIWNGLSFNTQVQYETRRLSSETYNDVNSYKMRYAINALTAYNATTNAYTYIDGFSTGGRYKQATQQTRNYSFRNQLNFNRSFDNNKHQISAIAGMEMRETLTPRSIEQLRYGYDPVTLTSSVINSLLLSQTGVASYIFGSNRTLAALNRNQTETKHRYFSRYANANYTFLSKYNLSGSYRVDGADLFGAEPKYKNRPLWSIGTGWNASNEDFLKDIKWLDLLKVRATYGVSGNVDQTTSPYTVATRRNDALFQSLQFINITTQPNPMLRWEKAATTNFGIDYSLFNNKLRGSIDVYRKLNSDLLATTDLDPTVGANSRRINAGALVNRGVEFSLGSDWFNKNDFRISSNVNIGFNRTKVHKVTRAQGNASVYVTAPRDYFFEGETFNALYAYKYGGMVNGYPYVLDENGAPTLTFDANGNPLTTTVRSITNPAALVYMGSITPTYSGSLSQRFSYKQIDLNMLFIFSGGNKMRKDVIDMSSDALTDMAIAERYTTASPNGNTRLLVDFADNMRVNAGTISGLWRNSDVNVVDGDYVKLRNVSLSYNLPKSFANKIAISSAKLTFQMNNIWYWSAAGDDIDPEVYSGSRSIPLPKTYLFGFNLTL
ncbi:TonB-dependent Receptor Plug Domain protein [compost metagenome]